MLDARYGSRDRSRPVPTRKRTIHMITAVSVFYFKYTSDTNHLLIRFPPILQLHQCSIRVLPDNGLVEQVVIATAKCYKPIITDHALHRRHLELPGAFLYKHIFLATGAYYCIFGYRDSVGSSDLHQCVHKHTWQER